MSRSSLPIRASGIALIVAGLCLVPLALVNGWQGIPAIATSGWWLVRTLAATHHVFLLFGLMGLYAVAVTRPGLSGIGAFVAASTGNLLVAGSDAIELTVLPGLASHPDASAGLDCTPFYMPATRAAREFTAQACMPWQFDALDAWVGIASLTLTLGALWLAVELVRAGVVSRLAALVLGVGWLGPLISTAVALPETIADIAWLAIALGLAWCGLTLLRWPSTVTAPPA